MIQQTSLFAYRDLKREGKIGQRQEMVLDCLEHIGSANNRMISDFLRLPINAVTPRVKELREKGLVEEAGRKMDFVTGKTTIFWRKIK